MIPEIEVDFLLSSRAHCFGVAQFALGRRKLRVQNHGDTRILTTNRAGDTCRVAFIGAGAMAQEHARAFADVPGVILEGVFSRTRTKAEEFAKKFGIPRVCASVAELHERATADLVVISVPPLHAKEIGLQCLQFPWCVLTEKPPGLDLKEALDLQSAAHRQNRRVFAALNRRFYFSTRTALEDLERRAGPRHIHVLDQQNIDFAAALGHEKAVLDNWEYACSIHLIDYLRIFGRGTPRVTHVTSGAAHNVLVANMEFDSGDLAVYECIWRGPGPWAVMVTTLEKRWEMRPLESLSYQNAGSRGLVPVTIDPVDTKFKAGFRSQAEHAVAAALGRPSQSVTLDDAVETVRLISKIYPKGWLSPRVGSYTYQ